jgi:hypothetical protein
MKEQTRKDNEKMKRILSFGRPDPVLNTSRDTYGNYNKIWEAIANQQKSIGERIDKGISQTHF